MGGKKSKSTTTIRPSPAALALENLKLEQERRLTPLRERAVSGGPGQAVKPTFESTGLRGSPYADLRFTTPETAAGMGTLFGLTDVGALREATRRNYRDFWQPELEASLIKGGFGRSGMVGEATGRALARMELPLIEEGREATREFGKGLTSLGQGRFTDLLNLANPSQITHGPTTTETRTVTQRGGFGDIFAPILGFAAAPFTGGQSMLSAGIGGLGSLGSRFFG